MTVPTDLYRYFDSEGRLLYVGVSFDALARARAHRKYARWWQNWHHMTREVYPTREDALAAEEQAIKSESPIYNIVFAGRPQERSPRSYPLVAAAKRMGLTPREVVELLDAGLPFIVSCGKQRIPADVIEELTA